MLVFYKCMYYIEVPWNGFTPKSSIFNRIFYQPSSYWGTPSFGNPRYIQGDDINQYPSLYLPYVYPVCIYIYI